MIFHHKMMRVLKLKKHLILFRKGVTPKIDRTLALESEKCVSKYKTPISKKFISILFLIISIFQIMLHIFIDRPEIY